MIIMPDKVTTQTIAPNSHNDNEYVKAYAGGIKKPGDFQVLQNQLSGMRSLETSIIILYIMPSFSMHLYNIVVDLSTETTTHRLKL